MMRELDQPPELAGLGIRLVWVRAEDEIARDTRDQISGLNKDIRWRILREILAAGGWSTKLTAEQRSKDFIETLQLGKIRAIDAVDAKGRIWGAITFFGKGQKDANIETVWVDEALRKKGIGRALVGSALEVLGSNDVIADISEENSIGQSFFEAIGWQRTDRVIDYTDNEYRTYKAPAMTLT